MKTISKREYNKAVNIIYAYEQQLQNKKLVEAGGNKFGFLWFNEHNNEFIRYIKAKDIDSACKKFLAILPKTIYKLDYEVSLGNKFIDISDNKELQNYMF